MVIKFSNRKLAYAVLFACIVGCFNSCRKDSANLKTENGLSDPSVALNKEAARAYYTKLEATEGVATPSLSKAAISETRPNNKYVMFKKAYESSTPLASFVEVPVYYNSRPTTLISRYSQPLSASDREKVLNGSFDRLVIYKSKETGKIKEKIVRFIPDLDYLEKSNFDISHNHVDRLDSAFSGYLEYRNWDNTSFLLLRIENGVPFKIFKRGTEKKSSTTVSTVVCQTFTYDVWQQGCYQENADVPIDPDKCGEWVNTIHQEWQECWNEETPPSNDPCSELGICDTEPIPSPIPYMPSANNTAILNGLKQNNAGFNNYVNSMNASEKMMAIQWPYQAYQVYLNAQTSLTIANILFPGPQHNNTADAFRHALWNGLNAKAINSYLATGFGDAHENFPENPPLEKQMDLFNNAVGRSTTALLQFEGHYSQDNLINALEQKAKNGQLKIIENGVLVASH